MVTVLQPRPLVEVRDLKRNLRIDPDVEDFDADLDVKLQAAIASAESFIGRDLGRVPVISYPYARVTALHLDPALRIVTVKIGGGEISPEGWSYAGGNLSLYDENHDAEDVVTVETAYRPDIGVAVLMHASSMWMNPADSVETLPKASKNLLTQYRTYAGGN